MLTPSLRVFILITIIAFATSCIMVVDPEQANSWQSGSEFRRSVDFEAGGTVTVEHTLGNVVISGWDNKSVEVVAVGRAGDQGTNRRVRVYTMDDLEPSIDVRQSGGILRIRTRSLGGPWASGGLDYAISVPSSVNLKGITLERGDVTISDVYGQVEAAISKGNLTVKNFSGGLKATLEAGLADVELLDIREGDIIDVTSQEGDITLRLEPGTNAKIEAEAKGGEITSDYDLGLKLPARFVNSVLGSGTARITLKALRGSIKILKTE